MTFDIDVAAKLLSTLVTVVLAVVKLIADRRPRLVAYFGHRSEHHVKQKVAANGDVTQPPFEVYTHSVVIANVGKKTAFNIRLGHQYMPDSVTLYPYSTPFKIEHNADGFAELLIPTLVAKEEVTVSYLYFPPITWHKINTYVKSDEGSAKVFEPVRYEPPSKSKIRVVILLMLMGAFTLTYGIIRVAYWLGTYLYNLQAT
ncbi:hypothetical protein HBDW_42090 [Herbaspirillum sp. DW155]|uniref:hypothetical protein n=1 Tax=Herbaspirillum sp. DW155 TaxID=3095609 RepID=UPI00308F0E2A|nr:hypothetical protein HBDW_42090 [Herbaspirillum sp. DW155]